jgi:tRNA 2-thiocytidine biosynthesis protein TtcA
MTNSTDQAAFWLLKNVNRAIRDYGMIAEGDRVAVAVSGGKDSLSLLRLLDLRRKWSMEKYELAAIHVIGDSRGAEIPVHQPLVDWLDERGYEMLIVPLDLPAGEPLPLGCQRCTWNRRKALFGAAQKLGCNVVAYGHHADDLAQTTLLNLLFQGRVETMAPKREYFGGSIRLVRPLCYTTEAEVRRYARLEAFPPPPPDCPRSALSQRVQAKEILRIASKGNKNALVNLLRAGLGGNTWTGKN